MIREWTRLASNIVDDFLIRIEMRSCKALGCVLVYLIRDSFLFISVEHFFDNSIFSFVVGISRFHYALSLFTFSPGPEIRTQI